MGISVTAASVLSGCALAVPLVLVGAGQQTPTAQLVTPMPVTTVETPLAHLNLTCAGVPIQGYVLPNRLEVTLEGGTYTLPEATAASGVRYTDGYVTLWNHGDEWLMIIDEGTAAEASVECVVH